MKSILGQSIIAELAAEYNTTIEYILTLPHRPPQQLAGSPQPNKFSADRFTALGQLAALRSAMQIVARQTHINLVLPK